MTVLKFFASRLLRAVLVLVSVTLVVFLLMYAVPGSPWNNFAGGQRAMQLGMDDATQRELIRRFGLDRPLWEQFTRYLVGGLDEDGKFFCGAVCGILGPSIQQRGRTVEHILFAAPEDSTFWESRFGYSVRLVLLGALIAAGLGIPLGLWSGSLPRALSSRIISFSLAVLVSIPNFVLGLLAMIILASWLGIIKVLPDWDVPSHWIVPAFVLAAMPMANIARVTRASMMNSMNEDYVRTARGKGLRESRIVTVHVLRNAFVPILTYLGPVLMEMFAGLLIVENLYSFPGLGRGYWESVLKLDYPMILGLTLIYAAGMTFIHILVEFLTEVVDPRVRDGVRGVRA